jgi:hypothetical protein
VYATGPVCETPCHYVNTDDGSLRAYCNDLENVGWVENVTNYCDCSCDDYVDVVRPSLLTMIMSFVTQSLVVTVVGVNMGFRKASLDREYFLNLRMVDLIVNS